MPDDHPKVRPLEIVPVQAQGRQAFLLRDPQRLSPSEIVLPADLAFLLSQFDGTRTVREAQVSYVRRFGTLLTSDKIEALLRRLDEALFLENARFLEFRAQVEAEFRARPTRPMAHAGRSYPETAAAFVLAWQPRLEAATVPDDFLLDSRRPALIAPHYDMSSAAESYAAAYRLLGETQTPEVVVILGVAHSGGAAPFALTRKPFETPFGALDPDTEIIEGLVAAVPFDLFSDEFLHRDEHSIEFQTSLLHSLYHDREPPRIVPILCGSYHRRGDEVVDPGSAGPTMQFLSALRDLLAADSRPVALIASADLSHIGVRFGQPPPLTQVHLELARRHDLALLERAQAGDADALYQALAAERDRYNVCGFPAIYALVRATMPREGRVLNYRQSVEPQTQSAVSFASVGLR